MRFLVDLNLSLRLARRLSAVGHDAVHATELDLLTAPDEHVLAIARDENRVVISADSDFGTILARTHASAPSVIFVRRTTGRRVDAVSDLITANLVAVEVDIEAGSIVVLGEGVVRVRRLPIL